MLNKGEGGAGHRVGIMKVFGKKKCRQIPHSGAAILGQKYQKNPHPG